MEEPKLIKRRGITDAAINKQRKILIIAIFCVITLFISTSYALLTNFDKTDNVVVFQTGNLNMSVNNTEGLINLNNKLPESDTDGLANATPIVLTLTNTGTILIEGFDVKLVSENSTTNVSTLSEDYIKYAISLDNGNTYQTPSILSSNDNIIYSGYNLDVNKSVTIYLKVWIDENAGNNAINKTYYGSIQVDLYQRYENLPLSETIKADIVANNTGSCETYVEEDGITYISGTKDCIDFNYVWYSGKLWRITAIYPDGTMKMITDDAITTINYGSNVNFYTDASSSSYMYQWLNEDFLSTLYNYENIIVTDASWNATNSNASSSSAVSTKLPETTKVTAPVGLLNSYEYYKSYQNTSSSNGYLNIGYWWWLLNPYSSSHVWVVNYNGGVAGLNNPSGNTFGVRPSVNLQSGITINGGTGTSSDPYTISGDKGTAGTTLLNTRVSGEYVNFDGDLYRIVGIENNTTKLNKMDYVRDESNAVITKNFSSSTTFGNGDSDIYWDYYLNNTWYNSISETYKNMLVAGTYYLGTVGSGSSYKGAICATASNTVTTAECAKTTSTLTGYVGLSRYGEMFASQQGNGYSSSSTMWLITPYSSAHVWDVGNYGGAIINYPSSRTSGVRPSINLSSAVKITGGLGTKSSPFEISL